MKKIQILFFLIFLFILQGRAQESIQPHYSYDSLMPDSTQYEVQTGVTKFLMDYHFKKFTLDDSLSSQIWDNYIESMDGGRLYFIKSEIEGFEKYRYAIDDAMLQGNLDPAFEAFNLFRKKYKLRADYISKFFESPVDYNTDLTISTTRKDVAWAKTEQELDAEWNKILINQAISLKLSGSTDSAVVATLKNRYHVMEKRTSAYRSNDVFHFFMNAFTESIDPHTSYMIPSAAENFNISMSQSIEGIGASLQNEGDYVIIRSIVPGGPLFLSGEGNVDDYIVGVAQGDDGEFQDIIGWLTDDAIKLIRGKKGSVIQLKLLASSAPVGTRPRTIRLVRDKINLQEAVAKGNVVDLEHNKKKYKLGVIDIPLFYRDFDSARKGGDFQSTTADVKKILEDFNLEKVDGVLIDLRNNGGGSLVEAIDLTGLFIKEGPVVQRKNSIGQGGVEFDTDKGISYAGPMVILQNRFSASASEIFAGAIQDYQRGLIVGENSFGKGTVQQLLDLDNYFTRVNNNRKKVSAGIGSKSAFATTNEYGFLKFTSEKFYRISGNSTQLKGVAPDIELPSPFDANEVGEGEYKAALAYDVINSTPYHKTGIINKDLIGKLEEKYQKRLSTDVDLQELVAELNEYKIERKKKEVSLNYDIRKTERDEADNKTKSIKKLKKSISESDKDDDVYLLESEKILGDLIAMRKK